MTAATPLKFKYYGGHRKTMFCEGDKVLIKQFYNNGNKHTWKYGRIKRKLGDRMYLVRVPDLNMDIKKHIDQLLPYKGADASSDSDEISCCGELTEIDDTAEEDITPQIEEHGIRGSPTEHCEDQLYPSESGENDSFQSMPDIDPPSPEALADTTSAPQIAEPDTNLRVERDVDGEHQAARLPADEPLQPEGTVTDANTAHTYTNRPVRSTRNKNVRYKL
ncbi:uncharacterized protein LOC126380227 isoform X2 [Pectinophora gossypiella]|uniref:uncharacterized protein LOC126380227 isoform X2 n=1 Tax=Pectinophora gossypiella TaxID=13191 RepID=UPI00214E56AF|nr:uncharacterized protein LOC126380227 isoform X2 [Pectinophora gossypiella]